MLTDEELIVATQNGDDAAENQLFERYKDLVTKISRGYFIVGGDIEDLIQEGMIGLYKAIKGFSPQKDASFKTFATICIKHQIQTAIKRASANKNKPLSSAVSLQSFDKTSENMDYLPLELGLSDFEIKILKQYLQGYSYKEIASHLNISQKSIDNALSRIKSKLRSKLK